MNQVIFKVCAVVIVFVGITTIASAQTQPINIITTAVPFLRISPDARAGGMGDAGIASTPDANAPFWDLAKVPFSESTGEVGATYTPWLKDIASDVYLATVAGFAKLDDNSAISSSIRYFNLGQIQFVDYNGNPLNTSRPREFSIDLGYSRKLSPDFSVGVALRYINSDLANGSVNGTDYKAGTTVAADLSIFHKGTNDNGEGLNYGLALSNLGGKIGYTDDANDKDFIPANLGLGGAYTWVFDEINKFTLELDVNKLLVPSLPAATGDESVDSANLATYHNYSVFQSWFKSFQNSAYTVSGGAEYAYDGQFFLRAGYFYEGKNQGDLRYFTAGVGLKYDVITLNFSYLAPSGNGITRNPLSNTLRFGVIFDLSADAAKNSTPTNSAQ